MKKVLQLGVRAGPDLIFFSFIKVKKFVWLLTDAIVNTLLALKFIRLTKMHWKRLVDANHYYPLSKY